MPTEQVYFTDEEENLIRGKADRRKITMKALIVLAVNALPEEQGVKTEQAIEQAVQPTTEQVKNLRMEKEEYVFKMIIKNHPLAFSESKQISLRDKISKADDETLDKDYKFYKEGEQLPKEDL
jgi:phosphate uptake regulator